jgi:hypothetical protein
MNPSPSRPELNGLRPLLKAEVVALVIQFVVLAAAIIYSWASLSSQVQYMRQQIDEHMKGQSDYVRTDLWQTRNEFMDQKLDRIEHKLDQIIDSQIQDRTTKK